jgi:transcriptional regulator with XRE-family HTH domain
MTKSVQEKFYQLLGINIRNARMAAKLKQEAFASYLELSRASVVNIEKGRQRPSLHLLCDISRVLNIELSDLVPKQPSQEITTKTSWEKIVGKKMKGNKDAGKKILGFLNDLNTQK